MNRNKRRQLISMTRFTYKKIVLVMVFILVLFVLTGILTTAKPSSRLSSSILSSWTSHIEHTLFLQLFSMELNTFDLYQFHDSKSVNIPKALFKFITSVEVTDINSFISYELPGLSTYESKVIVANESINSITGYAIESGPPLEHVLQDRKAIIDEDETEEIGHSKDGLHELTTGDRQVVFIYSTHNRESFLPHLPEEEEANNAYHQEVNITKVGHRLAQALEAQGIGTLFDQTDIMAILNDKKWSYWRSYDASRQIVKEAISQNDDLTYIFDIHRDSLPRNRSTKKINEQDYATILFVIGAEHKNYEKNLELATTLHYMLNEKYKGISRGVITKEGPNSNGIYNQDLNENALLIEIGAHENTMDEMYRTTDVLAEVFSDYYWEAEKVSR